MTWELADHRPCERSAGHGSGIPHRTEPPSVRIVMEYEAVEADFLSDVYRLIGQGTVEEMMYERQSTSRSHLVLSS